MIGSTGSAGEAGNPVTLMDELLRTGVPEIKLALGELIDRENTRPLPPKYARLLPPGTLVVILRGDAAEAVRSITPELERELTDSCNRHGSLYDRTYRVELQRTEQRDAPLYTVTARPGEAGADPVSGAAAPEVIPAARPAGRSAVETAGSATAAGDGPPLPMADPDATRLEADAPAGWHPHQWLLVVESEGEEREVFRIGEPLVIVGRMTDDPRLRPAIAISDAPHVSRRQLALRWQERDGAPGFTVYNLGLNAVHLPGQSIPGSGSRAGDSNIEGLDAEHTGWLPPGVPLRIGEHGPTLRVEEIPPAPDDEVPLDPDATVFG